jgi:CheY-like chemotaxis protein
MSDTKIIAVVDDDESVRMALDGLLRSNGYSVRLYANAEAFLGSEGPRTTACLISDIQMPGLSGIQLYETLHAQGIAHPRPHAAGADCVLSQAVFLRPIDGLPRRPDGPLIPSYSRLTLTHARADPR